MLGLPMWCTPTLPAAVRFYKDVAEACPDMAQCIYANPEAFRFDFPPPFWAQVADIPQVVSAKYTAIGHLIQNLEITRGKVRAMPIELDYYAATRVDDDVCAFWSSGAVCGPEPTIALRDEIARAKATGDWTNGQGADRQDVVGGHADVPGRRVPRNSRCTTSRSTRRGCRRPAGCRSARRAPPTT